MQGRIKLHRQSQENPLYFAEPFTKWQARQDMLLIANHKEWILVVRWNIIDVDRGQLWHSEDTLGERRKRSRGKVRRFLEHLEMIQQIIQHKSKVKSIITIINYSKFQWNDTTDGTTDGHQTVQQTDTNKNDKKKKEWKNIYSEEFEKIYKLFPHARKCKKSEAEEHFSNSDNKEDILAQVIHLKTLVKYNQQDIKYLPAFERRIRDFTPVSSLVMEKQFESICFELLSKWWWAVKELLEYYPLEKIQETQKKWNDKNKVIPK